MDRHDVIWVAYWYHMPIRSDTGCTWVSHGNHMGCTWVSHRYHALHTHWINFHHELTTVHNECTFYRKSDFFSPIEQLSPWVEVLSKCIESLLYFSLGIWSPWIGILFFIWRVTYIVRPMSTHFLYVIYTMRTRKSVESIWFLTLR